MTRPPNPYRHLPARAGGRGERGAVGSVQLVVVLPLLMGLFMAAMQAAMYYYGRTAAISIAQTGAAAAAAEHGTITDCEQAAATLQASIGDALTQVQITCQRTATRARTVVSGQVLSVFPGWQTTVVQQADADREAHMIQRWRDERGSVLAVELLVCAPLLAAFILLIVFGGRIALANQAVQTAAADAARAASIARTATAARTQAREWATTSLTNQGLSCHRVQVDVDTTGFRRPVGTEATITVRVSCDLDTADLAALPGIPPSMPIEASMTSPLDKYRERR